MKKKNLKNKVLYGTERIYSRRTLWKQNKINLIFFILSLKLVLVERINKVPQIVILVLQDNAYQ